MNRTATRHESATRGHRRTIPLRILGGVCAGLLSAMGSLAQAPIPNDTQFKAESLYHMAKLVEWPANAFSSTNSPFTVGVVGDESFVTSLQEIVKNKSIGSRRIAVVQFTGPKEIGDCHILFVRRGDEERQQSILKQVRGRSILTVGESESFLEDGGMIQFADVGGAARFKIHLEAAEHAGLKIGSKLLFLALPVYRPPPSHGEQN